MIDQSILLSTWKNAGQVDVRSTSPCSPALALATARSGVGGSRLGECPMNTQDCGCKYKHAKRGFVPDACGDRNA